MIHQLSLAKTNILTSNLKHFKDAHLLRVTLRKADHDVHFIKVKWLQNRENSVDYKTTVVLDKSNFALKCVFVYLYYTCCKHSLGTSYYENAQEALLYVCKAVQ